MDRPTTSKPQIDLRTVGERILEEDMDSNRGHGKKFLFNGNKVDIRVLVPLKMA